MTEEIIRNHWMTIGRSSKKSSFVSQKGRIQTGEKGIGRFALDRIADNCQMLTGTEKDEKKLLWTVDWNSFSTGKNITEIGADLDITTEKFESFFENLSSSTSFACDFKSFKYFLNNTVFFFSTPVAKANSEISFSENSAASSEGKASRSVVSGIYF